MSNAPDALPDVATQRTAVRSTAVLRPSGMSNMALPVALADRATC